MTVFELIELLQTFHPGMPVGYVNQCADDGYEFIAVDFATLKGPDHYAQGVPVGGAVVLS